MNRIDIMKPMLHGLGPYVQELAFGATYALSIKNNRPAKIGVSLDVRGRVASIQGGNWQEVILFDVLWFVGMPLALRVEKRAIEILKEQGKHIRGEWFDVTAANAFDVLKTAAQELGLEWFDDKERRRITEYVSECETPEIRKLSEWVGI